MDAALTGTLVGGRYDGFAFDSEEGWHPSPSDTVLYLGRPEPAEWERGIAAMPEGHVPTTTLVAVPYAPRTEHEVPPRGYDETYVRCADGVYRTPSLARCS